MRPGVDIRIDAQRHVRGPAARRRDRREQFQLRLRLHVDAENSGVDRRGEFARGLADAGEHDFLRRNAGGQRALQLAPRNDIGAGAELGQCGNDGLIGIRLHGVADERRHVGKRRREDLIVPLQRRRRIAIKRRADLVRKADKIDAFRVKEAVPVREMMHRGTLKFRRTARPEPLDLAQLDPDGKIAHLVQIHPDNQLCKQTV